RPVAILRATLHPYRCFFFPQDSYHRGLHSFPTRRSSDLTVTDTRTGLMWEKKEYFDHATLAWSGQCSASRALCQPDARLALHCRSEEHTSELQSLRHLVCRLLLEKKNIRNRSAPDKSLDA